MRASDETANGPLPGDRALFTFNLYTTAGLERKTGSAVLTCQYGFDRNAICDAAFDLEDGSRLIASGVLNPGATTLTLAVTSPPNGHSPNEATARETRVNTT